MPRFAEVMGALTRGASVSLTVDLQKGAPASTTTTPGTICDGLIIDAYRITPDGMFVCRPTRAGDPSGQPIGSSSAVK
ncbi:VirK family protein [Burkholderia sp. BCC1977]|uniref:VirK family protein n=1 Tax=Burkholderia sp. BCC1977 TaxID=2817440 RepID=UPI0039F1A259